MIKYTWNILSVEKSNLENFDDAITTINWEYELTDGVHIVTERGSTELQTPSAESFVSFEHVLKESLVYWIESSVNVIELQGRLNNKLAVLQNK